MTPQVEPAARVAAAVATAFVHNQRRYVSVAANTVYEPPGRGVALASTCADAPRRTRGET
jgi:hypothetical protein